MSITTTRLPFREAFTVAQEVLETLRPSCARIELAGSLRRQRPLIGDIELTAIPKHVPAGLFGDEWEVDPGFIAAVNAWPKVKGEPTGKYTQRVLPGGIKLDLFIATPENWGWLLALRTGSSTFNQDVMLPALKARGYVLEKGYLWLDGERVPTPEEMDVWRMSGLAWLDPWAREV